MEELIWGGGSGAPCPPGQGIMRVKEPKIFGPPQEDDESNITTASFPASLSPSLSHCLSLQMTSSLSS